MNKSKRCVYLDVVKCIAMLSVCLYHFPLTQPQAYGDPLAMDVLLGRYLRALNAVCVPLFMMVNGALLMNARFDARRHALRTGKLIIGVYVWYLLTQTVGHALRDGMGYVADHLPHIVYSALYLYEYDGVALTHLWFVQMLAALYLLVPLLRAADQSADAQMKKGLALFVAALSVLCFLVHDFDHVKAVLPGLKHLDLSCVETFNPLRGIYGAMLVYFLLGGWLHRHAQRLRALPEYVPLLMILGGSVVLFSEWLIMTKKTEALYDIVYYGYNCLPTLSMAAGVFLLAMRWADALPGALRRIAALVGRNTLAIYYLHWIFGLALQSGPALAAFPLANLLKAIVMVLLGALLGEGMRRVPVLRHLV